MNALTNGILKKEQDVYHITHFVKQLMTIMVPALLAIKDTT
jgi:hypothetical protein